MTSATLSQPQRPKPSALRLRRLSLGLRQLDVARAAGCSRQHIVALEQGRTTPSWPIARAVAVTLDCAPHEIFPLNVDDPPGKRAVGKASTHDAHHAV